MSDRKYIFKCYSQTFLSLSRRPNFSILYRMCGLDRVVSHVVTFLETEQTRSILTYYYSMPLDGLRRQRSLLVGGIPVEIQTRDLPNTKQQC
jgi:hypothetical protein